ncbi:MULTISPECIES: AAA family ATPase [unclassified Paenibacillus]|uniref:AAA family ATPase n=1 Tax=unclassified Paenibacillus TaxID=185978 RepID=UPI001047DE4A|nr:MULTISPECIES: AAA family ATPase [unclassified Paenibacillus]NIK67877.1 stage V sporulation protein K [Paenibacillus sp. BK720]TCN01918.1 stage V sporulation protein K [Paenibacillus sp. BK033]
MSGHVMSGSNNGARPSRQINVVLRSQEPVQMTASAPVVDNEPLPAVKPLPPGDHFADIQKELEPMVGMDNVKALVYEVYALLYITRMRAEAGLSGGSHVYHMIFKGNPGTGKTTIARIVAKLFQKMGVLSKGHLIEVERADLVGEYIGHTAQKTRDMVRKAIGGVLFVDEAYSLARGGEKDFGKEAIDTLVKAMEDHRNQFVLILAGYPAEIDHFLLTNPGLPSRFPIQIDFPDYSIDQLIQISELMAKERDYNLMPQSIFKLRQHLIQEKMSDIFSFSNARYVRNIIEKSIRYQAVRLLNQYSNSIPPKQELMAIKPEDFKWETK